MYTNSNSSQGSGNVDQSAPSQDGRGASPSPAVTVLVVEDDALTRKAVGRALQQAGYEVVLVGSAADALIVAQRVRFQVLVLDLHLADPDPFNGIHEGFGILDWVRRQVGGYPFRVIVHTSQGAQHLMRKAEAYGVFAFCIKRRDMSGLIRCVGEAVQSLKMP